MIPTNQFQASPSLSEHIQATNESQSLQFPKIDHILAHVNNPELSYIYARPELQATATANTLDTSSIVTKEETKTPKKGRPAKNKTAEGGEKKAGTKSRKDMYEKYDKYYLDTTKIKAPQPKKVSSLDKIERIMLYLG